MDTSKILHEKDYILKKDDKFQVSQAPHILKDNVELCETNKTSCEAFYTSQNEQFAHDTSSIISDEIMKYITKDVIKYAINDIVKDVTNDFISDILKDMEDIKDVLTFYANSTVGIEIKPGIYQTELKNGNQCLYNAIMARKALNKSLDVMNRLKSLTNDKK